MKLQTTPEMLNTMAISASVCVITSSNALVDAKELSALIADAREAHRLHAELQVSAAENLSKEEATRGTSPATPPPDADFERCKFLLGKSEIEKLDLRESLANSERTRDAAQSEANRLLEENRRLRSEIQLIDWQLASSRQRDIDVLIEEQREWSMATFGEGDLTASILSHIRKELLEIEDNPRDQEEWVDVILLAIDGFWRHGPRGYSGAGHLAAALWAKRAKNRARKWAIGADGQTSEHVREE